MANLLIHSMETAWQSSDQNLLAVAPENRVLALVGPAGRLVAGMALPQPQPIFPRYIEAEAT